MDLPMYHGKRIAVVVNRAGVARVFFGLAALEQDEDLGRILRISLQQEGCRAAGDPAFILQENAAANCLVADNRYSCDFCLNLGIQAETSV